MVSFVGQVVDDPVEERQFFAHLGGRQRSSVGHRRVAQPAGPPEGPRHEPVQRIGGLAGVVEEVLGGVAQRLHEGVGARCALRQLDETVVDQGLQDLLDPLGPDAGHRPGHLGVEVLSQHAEPAEGGRRHRRQQSERGLHRRPDRVPHQSGDPCRQPLHGNGSDGAGCQSQREWQPARLPAQGGDVAGAEADPGREVVHRRPQGLHRRRALDGLVRRRRRRHGERGQGDEHGIDGEEGPAGDQHAHGRGHADEPLHHVADHLGHAVCVVEHDDADRTGPGPPQGVADVG